MKMKTWKIGEYCSGGILRAKANGETIKIEVIDWNTKEILETRVFGRLHEMPMQTFLYDVTTSFYADKVVEWVKTNAWKDRS